MTQRSDYVKVYIQDESGHLVPHDMARWLLDAVVKGCQPKPKPKPRLKEARRARKTKR